MTSLAVIGVGHMGCALVEGLVASASEEDQLSITLAARHRQRAAELAARLERELLARRGGPWVRLTAADNAEAVVGADIVIVCVPPAAIDEVLEEISEALDDNDSSPVVVSVAAGVTIAALQEALPAGTPVVRAMPNTPSSVRKGVTAVSWCRYVTAEQRAQVTKLFERVGDVVTVDEANMDVVTAIASSAPAYVFLFAEALIDTGVQLGLPRPDAAALVEGMLGGAAEMLKGRDAVELRREVCSPGGATAAAIRELEESGLRAAVYRAAEACARRAAGLGPEASS